MVVQEGHIGNEDIVITGISGRFPESNNIEEFKQQLFAGIDLINDKETRWPSGLYGLPSRFGKIKNLKHFDNIFFGVHAKQADVMDPQLRILLEATYEALVDAGMNPEEFKGSKTGVFIGVSESDSMNYWLENPDQINGYALTGCSRAMFANRISYSFDLKGPSYTIDTACSSSLFAFQQAFNAIKTGQCDSAIVGGCNLLLHPVQSLQLHRLGMLSPDGTCKVFDAAANGYVRSEAVAVVVLQKANQAKRMYASVLGAKINNDGNKEQGITFSSGDMQGKLIQELYAEVGVDPAEVVYIETHGVGTKIGDPQEVNAIADIFCKSNRITPLQIGSVKSNMGHAEGASGLCSIAKIIIAVEQGVIPGNLHFKSPNTNIPALLDGRLKVVDKNEKWDGGLVAINSFGFGGANAHILLRSNPKPKITWPEEPVPRLIGVSGRTEESVNYFLDKIRNAGYDEELYGLINDIHNKNITGHAYRGYSILGEQETREISEYEDKRPIWYIFTGMGSQWPNMGRDLMVFDVFRNSIKRSTETLKPFGINLKDIILNGDESSLANTRNCFVSIAGIQIALVEMLKSLNIEPDGIIGHSVGEIGCAFADGTLTAEQTILVAYSRGTAILESNLQPGAMAAVGLKWDDCKRRCPPDVFPVCQNSENNVTISGPTESVQNFIEELTDEQKFAQVIHGAGFAFHSKYIADAGPALLASLNKIITSPKPRSSRWISTSIPESEWNSALAQLSSASYHVNNLLSPVYFYQAIKLVPENAIVIEIAPHCLLQAALKRSLAKSVTYITLTNKNHSDNAKFLLANIGKLYNAGAQPNIAALYNPITYPVSKGTPMLASMVKWNHDTEWSVANFVRKNGRPRELVIDIDMKRDEYKFLNGHVIDGRVLFPPTGYLTVAWKSFAKLQNKNFEQLPVILEDIKFIRDIIMPKDGSVKFLVNILKGTGKFEICEKDALVVTGKISSPENIETEFWNLPAPNAENSDVLKLTNSDIYKELLLRGYEYEDVFRGIEESDNYGVSGKLNWDGNWISFIDSMLQYSYLGQKSRKLYLTTKLQKVIINPKAHIDNGYKIIPVYMYKNLQVIKSGGIELRGMEASLPLERLQTQSLPILEKYQFVPLKSSDNNEFTIENTLTVATQLVIENSSGDLNLKVVEVVDGKPRDSYLLPRLQSIIEKEPMVSFESTIVTSLTIPPLEEISITIKTKDLHQDSPFEDAHLVILSNALTNSAIIKNTTASLKEGGFILFEESKNTDTSLLSEMYLEIVMKQTLPTKMYLLVRKLAKIHKSITIKITETTYDWIEELKETLRLKELTRIYLVCQGDEHNGLVGLMNCIKREPGGTNVRSIFIQDKTAENFTTTSDYYLKQLRKDLTQNVLSNGIWGTFRLLPLEERRIKLVEHAYINTITPGDLSSLQWIESPFPYNKNALCFVYYASINFNVLLATGKLRQDLYDCTEEDYIVGSGFSGRDSKGQRVMGMVNAKSLSTKVLADLLWQVPEKWSLEEAATIPVVYGTSYYALVVRGNMRPGESVLIHAGTGGVGQASISIALNMGCKVFTTVGSQAKRDFLKKRFPQLTDNCIGNSRDTSFEQLILTQTNGRGVDLILNSLAGEQLQASIRCLANGGRFLEIGRIDLSNNSAFGINIFLKKSIFCGILLEDLFATNNPDKTKVLQLVNNGIANGTVQPLPNTVFEENQVEQAFRFMASGKHIGKVLLKIRAEEGRTALKPSLKMVNAIPKSYMDSYKVYILVGGLGGFGLELTNWLVTRGAKKIVLASRSGIKTGYQSLCIRRWRKQNNKIVISTRDVTTPEGAKLLLEESAKLGPIGGIFNLAVVLKVAVMENQTKKDFITVCKPKVDGTKYLDAASRVLAPRLDYFVAFSSVSCSRGIAGQTNYGFANSAMERICEARHKVGLPAVAIQFAAIGDVDVFMETKDKNVSEVGGTLPQRIESCLATFDIFLQQSNPVVSTTVLANKKKIKKNSNSFNLTDAVANILGIKDAKTIAGSLSLQNLGMDSLMVAEIEHILERKYDLVLSAKDIRALTFACLIEFENAEEQSEKQENTDKKLIKSTDDLIPKTTIVKLSVKEFTKKAPIFMIHPIEGFIAVLSDLAKQINAPVYGLQCTSSAPLGSIGDLAKYYIAQIKTVQEKGPYSIVGYSFGAGIAFEMGIQIEAGNEKVRLFLIDGSPLFTVEAIKQSAILKKYDMNNFQSESILRLIRQFKKVDQENGLKYLKEIMELKTWEGKIKKMVDIIKGASPYTKEQLAEAAFSSYSKLLAGYKYKPSSQFKGKVILARASNIFFEIEKDYGLTNICKQDVKLYVINAYHSSILTNSKLYKLVNTYLCKD